ncbi:type 1 fimbrial protein [Dyella dinghuensis]|uniref:Type 1 fimbrial protein n=1 Tax=Dyella dinghuensis TaxID=1920169 RepID=A0A432LSX1_9GAMM|nr:fimbrial protein [Dyella dinghuensis]RUL64061.1 type 1 fimbrial protein [Dyella dinghuensis]
MMRTFLVAMGTAVLAIHASAVAAQTQFDITGEIDPGTCQWAVGDDDRTITFDPIDASVLNANGSGNFQTFSLTLQNCAPGMTSATFVFGGTSDTSDPLRFLNTGSAHGTAVELESADNLNIGANGTNNSRTVPVIDNGAVIALRAGYWRVGAVTAGSVSSVATVSVTYQ